MKTPILPLACLAALTLHASAAIIVPGADGSDGALNITANTEIDLGLAPTGVWDAAGSGNGVYDATKWAVVFKYSSVNVAAGATLTFKNNASRAPVVWLVSGNVTIDGTVSLNGQDGVEAPNLAEPGPGGFRAGMKNYTAQVTAGAGFGMGGGARVSIPVSGGFGYGSAGSFGSLGFGGNSAYGNPSLIPLMGGAGGGSNGSSVSGGAGGGALLLACSQSINLSGNISANGGAGQTGYFAAGGSGSGGGIRIITDGFSGSGLLQTVGGSSGSSGGNGRIRIERVTNTATIIPAPDPSVVDLAANSTALIWPPSGAPEVKIISVGGNDPINLVPADPKAGFGTIGADVSLPSASTTTVVVETTNVEAESTVKIRITPRSGANYAEANAGPPTTVTNNPLVLRWTASLQVATGYNAVQARVIRP